MYGISFFANFTVDIALSTKVDSIRGFGIHFYRVVVGTELGNHLGILECGLLHFFTVGTPVRIEKQQNLFWFYQKGIFQLLKTKPFHLLFLREKGGGNHKYQTNAEIECGTEHCQSLAWSTS